MASRTPKKPSAARNAPQPVDAVQMLKADHKQVRKLFEQLQAAKDEERGPIATRLFAELDVHSKLEEELFYPAVQAKLESFTFGAPAHGDDLDAMDEGTEIEADRESVDEINGAELEEVEEEEESEDVESEEVITAAFDSHEAMKDLIQQLQSLDPKSLEHRELCGELEDAVIEHVAEEEDVILPLAAERLDIRSLGIEMQRRKDDLSSQSPSLAA